MFKNKSNCTGSPARQTFPRRLRPDPKLIFWPLFQVAMWYLRTAVFVVVAANFFMFFSFFIELARPLLRFIRSILEPFLF
jgi:hypothetical protein